MRVGIIYKIEIKDRFIYGSTMHPNKRKTSHFCDLKANRHGNPILQSMYNKYKDFNFTIVQQNIPEEVLRVVEDIWIGATCAKSVDGRKGMNIMDGTGTNLDKISKQKISEKRSRQTGWENAQAIPINQLDLEGNLVKVWPSAYEVEKELGFLSCHIGSVCKNLKGHKTYKGFKWTYFKK